VAPGNNHIPTSKMAITIPARESNFKGLNCLKKLSNEAKLEFPGGWHCIPTRIPLWGILVTSGAMQ